MAGQERATIANVIRALCGVMHRGLYHGLFKSEAMWNVAAMVPKTVFWDVCHHFGAARRPLG
jgi:hypothetical protein